MKNLVPDSIKYSSTPSFTYSSYPTKPMELLAANILCVLGDGAKERPKVTSGTESKAKRFRGSGCTVLRGKAPRAPCSRKQMGFKSLLLPAFPLFREAVNPISAMIASSIV